MAKVYYCAQCGASNIGLNAVQLHLVKGLTWAGKLCVLCDSHFKLIHEISLRGRTPITIQPILQ